MAFRKATFFFIDATMLRTEIGRLKITENMLTVWDVKRKNELLLRRKLLDNTFDDGEKKAMNKIEVRP